MRQTFVRRSVLGFGLGGAVSALLLGRTTPGNAATVSYKATMNGATEVPPNTTAGSGTVTATFDPATKMLSWEGTFSGLTGPPRPRISTALPRRQERRCRDLDLGKRHAVLQPVRRLGDTDRRPGRPTCKAGSGTPTFTPRPIRAANSAAIGVTKA